MKFSIKKKLFLSFLTTIVLPILIICIVVGLRASRQSFESFTASTGEIIRQIDNSMNIFINEAKLNTAMLINSRELLKVDDRIPVYKNTTRKTEMRPFDSTTEEIDAFALFKSVHQSHPAYDAVFLGTRQGGFLMSPLSDRSAGYDPTQRPWYKAALTDPGKPVLTEAYISTTGYPVSSLVMTVKNQSGQTIGVAGIDISLGTLTDITANLKLGDSGFIMLIEDNGTILSNPLNTEWNFTNIADHPEIAELARLESSHTTEIELNGRTMVAYVFISPQLGWKIIGFIEKQEIMADAYAIITSMIIIGALLGIVFMVIAHFLSNSIANPISKTTDLVKNIAQGEGDLTKRLVVTTTDEVGELAKWFNLFVDNLENIISNVKNSAIHLDMATNEVAAGGQNLSQSSQEQASAVEEVAATIEEMTSAIKQNAENASQGSIQTKEMVKLAGSSGEIAQHLVGSMNEISEASKKIGDIIGTANEVAFQTNLLALNAAVEAARAGEHGKGFAVVAEEVRALAQRSDESAKEIRVLIESTVEKIKSGDSMVRESDTALQNIITHIETISQTMEEIAASSSEQAGGIDELNRAISQIDSSTQMNASTVEELASTSDNMSIEAKNLAQMVGRFKVSGKESPAKRPGRPAASAPRTPPARQPAGDAGFVEDDFEEF